MNGLATVAGVEGRKRLLVLGALVGALWVGHPALALFVGTAICGGTAIVTLAPIIRARPESVAVSIGIVFLLNAAAILVLPWLLVLPVTWVAAMAW